MRAIVYPNLLISNNESTNPYIQDFIKYLELQKVQVINAPHKNPLVSLFLKQNMSMDVCFFHWIENVPLYKYGYLQTLLVVLYIFIQKLRRKKIVWFLHNKQPHEKTSFSLGLFLMKFLINYSDLIITHAKEGVDLIVNKYPKWASKVYFLDHPTKDRMRFYCKKNVPTYDLLIWGTISKYKGVLEFVQYASNNRLNLKIKIIGRCDSTEYMSQLLSSKNDNIQIENKALTFEELAVYMSDSRFVLIPYMSESLLSSGILMDSLSFGCKIIGPNVGSFKDYSKNIKLKVFVFNQYDDIKSIVDRSSDSIDVSAYSEFLYKYSWPFFMERMLSLIKRNKLQREEK